MKTITVNITSETFMDLIVNIFPVTATQRSCFQHAFLQIALILAFAGFKFRIFILSDSFALVNDMGPKTLAFFIANPVTLFD